MLLQRLQDENRALKRLLGSLGLNDEHLAAFQRASNVAKELSSNHLRDDRVSDMDGLNSGRSTIPIMQDKTLDQSAYFGTTYLDVSSPTPLDIMGHSSSFDASDHVTDMEHLDTVLASPTTEISSMTPTSNLNTGLSYIEDIMYMPPASSINKPLIGSDSSTHTTSNTTTLCSVAYAIIMKNNVKGYSPVDIDLKLRVRYQYGASSDESCRVDNKTLFSVLAEVS